MTEPAVLFVCLGNICRSPMAEGAFRQAAEAAGLSVVVDSAGFEALHVGDLPDPRAVRTAALHGVDISEYRVRVATADDFWSFTHIFAMDHRNLADLRSIEPSAHPAHLSLLLDLVPGREGAAVADPYYGGEEHFEDTWADVSRAAAALVEALRR
jgi:protein-tyrosine phosphatase